MINRLHHTVGVLSANVAGFAGHAAVQLAVLVASVTWLIVGGSEAALASTMTIGGFILTQMVLNQQRRQQDALHLKIDELIRATQGARDEVARAEQQPEHRIEELRRGQEL